RLDEALKHLQEAVSLAPGSSDAHMNFGNVLRAKGRLDEGIEHLREAARLNPKAAMAHYNLAAALLDKGQPEEAIDPFQQALKCDPKFAAAQHGLSIGFVSAARTAVWVADGQGSGKERASELERASLRAMSLGWLQANLKLTAKMRVDGQAV